MRTRGLRGLILLAAVGVLGCGTRKETAPPPPVAEEVRLGDHIDVSLADWLKLPRPELVKLMDEWTARVKTQQTHLREVRQTASFLPKLQPALMLPIFREARFSPQAGFSLPDYVKAVGKDRALALHLARHGDSEAAAKFDDPDDKDLQRRLKAVRPRKNYPLEWTRLVSLLQYSAQLRLAEGEVEAATELVQLHKQLRKVLDERAALGALGAALLPVGRHALAEAAAAWSDPKTSRKALVQDITDALAGWGTLPPVGPALLPGAAAAEVTAYFGSAPSGRTLTARGAAAQRVLDLTAVPVPPGPVDTQAVLAFLDDKEQLAELLVLYPGRAHDLVADPAHLVPRLVDRDCKSTKPVVQVGVQRQEFTDGPLVYDCAVTSRSSALGAWVRLAGARPLAPAFAHNPRDLGAVHLDSSFEECRLCLAPRVSGNPLVVEKPADLARLLLPSALRAPTRVALQRWPDRSLVETIKLQWDANALHDVLGQVMLPLWAAYGAGQLEGREDEQGHLALTWEDGKTRVRLRVPYGQQPPSLVIEDARGSKAVEERVAAAAQLDRQRRKARLDAGKTHRHLTRALEVREGATFELGMTKTAVKETLLPAHSFKERPLKDGLALLFRDNPEGPPQPREVFVRFGPDDRVVEIRARYWEGRRRGGKDSALLAGLKKRNGAAEELPAPWAELWTDLPAHKPAPVLYRFHDDHTLLTCQQDADGTEVTWRDCPPQHAAGVPVPPLTFCARGVPGCELGMDRDEVLKKWPLPALKPAGGADVLPLPASSPYEVLLVWWQNGKAVRLVARHRHKEPVSEGNAGAALQQAWSAAVDHLGYIRRQEGRRGLVLQRMGFHDDRTRVLLFVQQTKQGGQVFTEWRDWPVPPATVADRR